MHRKVHIMPPDGMPVLTSLAIAREAIAARLHVLQQLSKSGFGEFVEFFIGAKLTMRLVDSEQLTVKLDSQIVVRCTIEGFEATKEFILPDERR
ncbi:hypothetical protein OCUBac02_42670 [Bosea sp. ANAM02]|nr:hypothetical protein OCUBac02_42670 [Bosea sp. ANAM02]